MIGTIILIVIAVMIMSAVGIGLNHRIKLNKAVKEKIAQNKKHEEARYARAEAQKTKQLEREKAQELTSQIIKKTVNILMTDAQVRQEMMSALHERARISLVVPLFYRALGISNTIPEHKKTHDTNELDQRAIPHFFNIKKTHGTNELARRVITHFFNIQVRAARKEINVSDQLSSFSLHSSMSIDDALVLGKKNAKDTLEEKQRQRTARQEHEKYLRQEREAAEARRMDEERRLTNLRNRAQKLWTGMTPAQQQQVISGVDDRAKVAALTVYAGSRDTARNMLPMLKGIDFRLLSGSGFTPSSRNSSGATRRGLSKTLSSSSSSTTNSSATTSSYSSRSSSGSDDIVRTAATAAALSSVSDDSYRSSTFGGGYSGGPDVSFGGGGYDSGSFTGGGGSGDW